MRKATPSSAAWRRSAGVVANVSPVIAPVAVASQPVDRSPPRNGTKVRPWSRASAAPAGERPLEPVVEVAAVGERAALDDAPLVEPVEEEAGLRLGRVGLVENAERGRGADHQRGAARAGAAGAEVRAGAVEERRVPAAVRFLAEQRQPLLADAGKLQELGIPAARVDVEQPCRRGEGDARHRFRAEQLGVEVVGHRNEPRRGSECLRLGLGEPEQLRRPERGMEVLAGPRVHGSAVGAFREPSGRARGADVAPAEHRRQRPPGGVEREQAVPERRHADRVDGLVPTRDDLADEADDLVRIVAAVRRLPQLVGRLAPLVEDLGPDGRGADVDREHRGHAANLPLGRHGGRDRIESPQGVRGQPPLRRGVLQRRAARSRRAFRAERGREDDAAADPRGRDREARRRARVREGDARRAARPAAAARAGRDAARVRALRRARPRPARGGAARARAGDGGRRARPGDAEPVLVRAGAARARRRLRLARPRDVRRPRARLRRRAARPAAAHVLRRRADACVARTRARRRPGSAAARRADEPSRRGEPRVARARAPVARRGCHARSRTTAGFSKR